MTSLKITSNYENNTLAGVGKAALQDGKILITAEPNTEVTLLRGVNKVILLQISDKNQTVNGAVVLGDVYTLENGEQRLIIKVEAEETKHETSLYINEVQTFDAVSTKRKNTLTVGVLILALLIVSVVFGVNQKNKKEFDSKSESKFLKAVEEYEKSISEETIDKNSSRQFFISSKEIAYKLKEDGYKNSKLDELITNLKNKEAEVLGEIRPDIKELLDLTLQINDFKGSSLASTNDTIFMFDSENKNVVSADIFGKNAKISAGKDELAEARQIASYEDRLFSITNSEIFEIKNNAVRVKEKAEDTNWDNSLFYLYSGNIYLINKNSNQIERYSGNGGTFGDKTDWLAPGIEADFSKVIDMVIDGSIWLLSSSGKVTKFTNGNPNQISLNGITTELVNPTAIYTNEDLKYTYILDNNEGRVIVLEKNGEFKLQYKSDEIKNAKDLVVTEEEKKIILLTGAKLMYIPL